MAINVTEKINIMGTANSIAAYMFNPENDKDWIGGVLEVKSISKIPVEEGTEIHRIAHFLGKDIDYILKVTKIEPGEQLSMESIKSPFPMKVDYAISQNEADQEQEDHQSCMVSIRISGESKGYFMFIDRLLSLMVSQNVRGDLRKLKNVLEGEDEDEEI